MFNVKDGDECVGFDSKWKVKRVFTEGASQTTEYSLQEISTSPVPTANAVTQTHDDDNVKNQASVEVDMEKLAAWLTGIYPRVQKELSEAVNSKAFGGSYAFDESVIAEAKLMQVLNVSPDLRSDNDNPTRVSAVCWNSTGNTLALSCTYFHKTWCNHRGQVNFYTFDRNDKLPDSPNKTLLTSACVSMMRFHPSIPSAIACATYCGEIIIWNVQNDGDDCVVAKVNAHEDGVTDLSWMHDIDIAKTLLLASSSLDGCLNLWNFKFLPACSLKIKQQYKIKSPVLARIHKTTNVPNEIFKKVILGILSFDFSIYAPDMFVVGVEGGLVVQCCILGATPLKGSTKDKPIADPVYKYYEPHEGKILTVRCSPNRQDMFMTTASDGELRIYTIGQDAPARVIFLEKQLGQVCWVPYQEKLVIGCGERGTIEIFHLISGRPIANVTNEKMVQSTLLQMAVNKQRCATVAIGNNLGELQLWTVPWSLFASQK